VVKLFRASGAKHAFEAAFDNSTTTQIDPEGIEDIPCLIIWGEKDNLMPYLEYYYKFQKQLPNADYVTIADAGHAPFVEKTALVHEKLRTFLMQDDAT
jgi:pimeloyl-ACP methyl ester carboxylesterase